MTPTKYRRAWFCRASFWGVVLGILIALLFGIVNIAHSQDAIYLFADVDVEYIYRMGAYNGDEPLSFAASTVWHGWFITNATPPEALDRLQAVNIDALMEVALAFTGVSLGEFPNDLTEAEIHDEYGLTRYGFQVMTFSASGGEPHLKTLFIGDPLPDGSGYYAFVSEGEDLYAIPTEQVQVFLALFDAVAPRATPDPDAAA